MKNRVNSAIQNNIQSYTPVGGDEFESEPQQRGRGNSKVQNLELENAESQHKKCGNVSSLGNILRHLFGVLLFNIMRRKNIVCEATHHHHLEVICEPGQ